MGLGGGSRLGFKLKVGHHEKRGTMREDNVRPCGKERSERTLAGGP